FIIWKHKADDLGIKLTQPDVEFCIRQEFLDSLPGKAEKDILNYLRQSYPQGYSRERLIDALRDEFTVRTAQMAFGAPPLTTTSRTAIPASVTPDEEWAWYRDVRTTVRVGLIEVPVSSFVAHVKETPTQEELKKLYDQYKGDEYTPFQDHPGFREPRKIKVE